MATTYIRMQYALRLVASRKAWVSRSEIAKTIHHVKPDEMKIRGDGSAIEHYMSDHSISNLLTLMSELNLVVIQNDGKVSASATGRKAVDDPEVFKLAVQVSIKKTLKDSGAPIQDVHNTIHAIRPPLAPDAKTIHDRMSRRKPPPEINFEKFRQLLYLYACAGGIERSVRIHYIPEG
ncbi:hypothetical protein [Streptomyces lunaelactis]|uniref:hypothetical protein n=1 Tax=Streptomyces lunaelactis TaxID=1535768 RepID=UPI00158486AB|nr:hypothetical protein [Streptomyces lunaelactis]NUL21837.1 hypothetical protein [Streptomyces lunaelactis]